MTDRRAEGGRRPIAQLDRGQLKALFQGLEFSDGAAGTAASADAPGLEGAGGELPAAQHRFVRHWAEIARRSDPGLARLFVERAPQALSLMPADGVEAWLLEALAQYDRRGLGWAVKVLDQAAQFAADRAARDRRLTLDQVSQLLSRLCRGWGGRALKLEAGASVHVDTETLYLPPVLDRFPDREENFRLYKACAAHHWAQTWYGTWRAELLSELLRLTPPQLARFAAAERLRLDACLARDLPGVHRDLRRLAPDYPARLDGEWRDAATALSAADRQAADSLAWALRATGAPPPAAPYHGEFHPQRVRPVLEARLRRGKARLQKLLGRLRGELVDRREPDRGQPRLPRVTKPDQGFSLGAGAGRPGAGPIDLQLYFDRRPVPMPDALRDQLLSLAQDLNQLPDDYFQPGGPKPYNPDLGTPAGPERPGLARQAFTAGDGAASYPEWDYGRQRFRPDYCRVLERAIEPGDETFVADTLQKYRGLVLSVRRAFEALLAAPRLERRQPNGDDLDLDALVAALADARRGEELDEAVYTRLRNTDRSIAVMFAVDISGSTKGWVIDAEREALVILCAALEAVGDQYAIYGFSGRTHRRVESFRIKRFDEPYTSAVQQRISGIRPHAYTRMGAALRHLGGLLGQTAARHKLLVTLSDGRPEDYGSYYGRYGIEDTRHALAELRRCGIHPFCITLDKEGPDYLPALYGPASYVCIQEVTQLPLKVADIYRRLTS